MITRRTSIHKSHTDNGPAKSDISPEVNVPSNSQMIQLQDLRDLLEPFLELLNLFEMVTQFDDRRRLEHPLLVDDELTVLERVDVTLDEEKIGARFDGQEARTGDVDAVGVLEVLDGCSGGGFELRICTVSVLVVPEPGFDTYLNDSLTIVCVFGVDDDLQLHPLGLHDSFESCRASMRLN